MGHQREEHSRRGNRKYKCPEEKPSLGQSKNTREIHVVRGRWRR